MITIGCDIQVILYVAFPFFFFLLTVLKRNVGCMVACIVSSIVVMPFMADDIGPWTLAPMLLIVLISGLMLLRDAWERRIEL